eukprot:2346119-Pyramimonas_sp.AAC.1
MDFGRSALSISLRWTISHKMVGTVALMALQNLAVSTSRVSPPALAFAWGLSTAFATALSPEEYLII